MTRFLLQTWIVVPSTKTSTSFALERVADRELLVVDGGHAVGSHAPEHPLAAEVLGTIDRDRGLVLRERREAEPVRGRRHLEGLVRAHRVVVRDPRVERGLRGLERRERPVCEELLAQALVEPFNLAGRRRRAHGGMAMGDPVLPADPVEEHLDGSGSEASGEDLAFVGEAGIPWVPRERDSTAHTAFEVALGTNPAATQNRL